MLLSATLIDPLANVNVNEDPAPIAVNLFEHFDDPAISGTVVRFDTVPIPLAGGGTIEDYFAEMFDGIVPLTVANFLAYVNGGAYTDSFIHRELDGFVIQGGGFTFDASEPDPANGYHTIAIGAPVVNEFANHATVSGTNASATINTATVQLPAGTDLSNVQAGNRIRLIGVLEGIQFPGPPVDVTDFFGITAVNDAADTVTVTADQMTMTPVSFSASFSNVQWYIAPDVNVRGTLSPPKAAGDPDSATAGFFVNLANNATNLDAQNEGFAAFGRVLFDGMNTVDAIEALVVGPFQNLLANAGVDPNIAGAMGNLPVIDYTQEDFNAGVVPDETNLVLYDGASIVSELAFEVIGNTNTALVTPSINNGQLNLAVTPNLAGQATITVRATDLEGNMVTDAFDVTVDPANDDPVVVVPLTTVTVDENADDTMIDGLLGIFNDVDIAQQGDMLSFSVPVNSNPGLVTPSIVGNALVLAYAHSQHGRAQITVRATDLAGKSVDNSFTVVVNPQVIAMPMGETGQITTNSNGTTVMLQRTYMNPVLFVQPTTRNGADTAIPRIVSVQRDRFTMFIEEAPDRDGPHPNETVSYLVLEAGLWQLEDGTRLEVGARTTSATVGALFGGTFEAVAFQSTFSAAPAVISQVQTYQDASFVTTRNDAITAAGFNLAMEQEEAATDPHGAERVGYMAIAQTAGTWSGHAFESVLTGRLINNDFGQLDFTQTFAAPPGFLAALATYTGLDSAHLRYQGPSLNTTGVRLLVEEDTTRDAEVVHTKEALSYLAIEGAGVLMAISRGAPMAEVGNVTGLTHVPVTVMLTSTFKHPVVFAKPASRTGSQPASVRVTDVQSDRFTLFIDESQEQDGFHVAESVSYIVLEAGVWELADGTVLEVGALTTARTTGRLIGVNFEIVSFLHPFDDPPVLLTAVQTFNDTSFVETRQRNTTATGFQVTMEQEEAATMPHGAETIGYMAIEAGAGNWSGHLFDAASTANAVTDKFYTIDFNQAFTAAPNFIGALATQNGFDSAHLRQNTNALTAAHTSVKVEEDVSHDAEMFHGNETVSYLAIQGAGVLMAEQRGLAMGEVGQVNNLTHAARTIVLQRTYVNPVVLAMTPSRNGSNTAIVRITNVQSDRFTFRIEETPDQDGFHGAETVAYLVLEAGLWQLADGSVLQVGTVTTGATAGSLFTSVFAPVAFDHTFSAAPAVVSQVQTMNDPSYVSTRQRNATTGGVELAMEQEEAATEAHGAETIGFLAFEPGTGDWNGHVYEAAVTPDAITSNPSAVAFTAGFTAAPRLIASLASYDGADPSHLRFVLPTLLTTGVQMRVEEDATRDAELGHTTETVAFLALQGSGRLIAAARNDLAAWAGDSAPPPGPAPDAPPAPGAPLNNALAAAFTAPASSNNPAEFGAFVQTQNDVAYRWLNASADD